MTPSSSSASTTTTTTTSSSVKLLTCGFISGLSQAGVFNPWDRALYLAQKHDRKFLNSKNFERPMTGVVQTIVQRALSAGLYFPLEEIFRDILLSYKSNGKIDVWITVGAGNLAGAINGFVMNPVAAIKYHYWGTECGKENFLSTSYRMYQKGGIHPFVVGTFATISRDLIFGGTFAFLRHELLSHNLKDSINSSSSSSSSNNSNNSSKRVKHTSFMVDLMSGCMATIFSSPFNYVRNTQYATPPGVTPLSCMTILVNLWNDILNEKNIRYKLNNLQSKLRLGWGTARVGCGMAFGAQVYSLCSSYII